MTILLGGCVNNQNIELDSDKVVEENVTTTIQITAPVTTTVPETTTSPVTTTTVETTTKIQETTPITTTTAKLGSVLSPVTAKYIMNAIADKETFYIYLGVTSCPHCQAYKPVVEETLKEVENVKFVGIFLDEDTSPEKAELVRLLELEFIPMTVQVQDGEIVDTHTGEMSKEELLEFMK